MEITPQQSNKKYPFLNWRFSLVSFLLALAVTFNCVYLFRVASTFAKYVDSLAMTVSTIISVIIFGNNISKMKQLFIIIECIEDMIQKSKTGKKYSFEYPIKICLFANYRVRVSRIQSNLRGKYAIC